MAPAAVRAMRPSEVASVLGLDLTDSVTAVPLRDGEFRDTSELPDAEPPTPGEQRLRRVI